MKIQTIAVIGAGIMGSGVALDLAIHGYPVVLKDINESALDLSRKNIRNDYRLVKMMKKSEAFPAFEEILARIRFVTSYDTVAGVDLIIENIIEEWDAKKRLYMELAAVCAEETLIAVNTSCISITKIASLVKRPENVIGAHFMNPVPLKEMVETIKGYYTSDQTVATLTSFLKTLGKTAVLVNDFPGFVANRLSHLFMNEAAFLIQDQVASPEQVDRIFTMGYGHAMGPLETADLIGLDTVVQSLDVLYQNYQDTKFRCCPLLRKMVDAGLLGRKSGKGFYSYV